MLTAFPVSDQGKTSLESCSYIPITFFLVFIGFGRFLRGKISAKWVVGCDEANENGDKGELVTANSRVSFETVSCRTSKLYQFTELVIVS